MSSTMKHQRMTSQDKIIQSHRNGPRGTVYGIVREEGPKGKDVIQDKTKPVFPFKQGSTYKGEWSNDMKNGFGTEIAPSDGTTYSGQWLDNERHGRGTLWVKRGNKSVHQYVGEWCRGRMEGYGAFYYENGDEYKGDWRDGKRWGSGRIDYVNGDYYMGEWENDSRKGFGTYHYSNGNAFEGIWLNNQKEGRGRFFYASTRKVYDGEWVNDQAKSGEFRDPLPNEMNRFGNPIIRRETFELPRLTLKDPQAVLELAIAEIRNENLYKRGISNNFFSNEVLEEAAKMFTSLDVKGKGVLSVYSADKVFEILGLKLTRDVLREIMKQVDFEDQPLVSLIDVVDIASCILCKNE